MTLQAKYCNPRLTWCFRSEDFVGRISRMTHSVCMGVKSTHLSAKVGAKCRHFLHLSMERSVEEDWEEQ